MTAHSTTWDDVRETLESSRGPARRRPALETSSRSGTAGPQHRVGTPTVTGFGERRRVRTGALPRAGVDTEVDGVAGWPPRGDDWTSGPSDLGRAPASAATAVAATCFRARLAGERELGRGTDRSSPATRGPLAAEAGGKRGRWGRGIWPPSWPPATSRAVAAAASSSRGAPSRPSPPPCRLGESDTTRSAGAGARTARKAAGRARRPLLDRCAADAPKPSAAGGRRRGSSRRRRPTAGPRTSGSPHRSPGAPVGGICRAHARRRPGTRNGCGDLAARRSRASSMRHHRTTTSKALSHSSPVPDTASFPSSTSVTPVKWSARRSVAPPDPPHRLVSRNGAAEIIRCFGSRTSNESWPPGRHARARSPCSRAQDLRLQVGEVRGRPQPPALAQRRPRRRGAQRAERRDPVEQTVSPAPLHPPSASRRRAARSRRENAPRARSGARPGARGPWRAGTGSAAS